LCENCQRQSCKVFTRLSNSAQMVDGRLRSYQLRQVAQRSNAPTHHLGQNIHRLGWMVYSTWNKSTTDRWVIQIIILCFFGHLLLDLVPTV